MTDVPLLPELEIGFGTKRRGVSQEIIDAAMRFIYATRSDFFPRMAHREHALDCSMNDDLITEFYRYIYGDLGAHFEVKKAGVAISIVREFRRRARLMYGLNLFRLNQVPPPPVLIDERTGAELFDKYYEATLAAMRSDSPPPEHYVFVFRAKSHSPGEPDVQFEFYAHKITKSAENNNRYGYEIDNEEIRKSYGHYVHNDPDKIDAFKKYLWEMLMFELGLNPGRHVEFKDGVNCPPKKYGMIGHIVQPIVPFFRLSS